MGARRADPAQAGKLPRRSLATTRQSQVVPPCGAKGGPETQAAKRGESLYQRLGWAPRCKPTILPSGRILLPLYSDTFSISIMAVSDDNGLTWYASQPLIGFGNIQPTVLRRNDGTLVAYMGEKRPQPPHPRGRVKGRRPEMGTGRRDLAPQSRQRDRLRSPGQRPLGADLQRLEHPAAPAWPFLSRTMRAAPGKRPGTWNGTQPATITTRPSSKATRTLHAIYSCFIASDQPVTTVGEKRKGPRIVAKGIKHAAFNEASIRGAIDGCRRHQTRALKSRCGLTHSTWQAPRWNEGRASQRKAAPLGSSRRTERYAALGYRRCALRGPIDSGDFETDVFHFRNADGG